MQSIEKPNVLTQVGELAKRRIESASKRERESVFKDRIEMYARHIIVLSLPLHSIQFKTIATTPGWLADRRLAIRKMWWTVRSTSPKRKREILKLFQRVYSHIARMESSRQETSDGAGGGGWRGKEPADGERRMPLLNKLFLVSTAALPACCQRVISCHFKYNTRTLSLCLAAHNQLITLRSTPITHLA